jgi:hypothetical protein
MLAHLLYFVTFIYRVGGPCVRHNETSYANCQVRCWGHSYPPPTPYSDEWSFPNSVRWTYRKDIGMPQGRVSTIAGGGGSGFLDGTGKAARFNNPQDIVLDRSRNIYVADTGNHAIRKITPSGVVTTYAGTGASSPFRDGLVTVATFSSPKSITLYYDASQTMVNLRFSNCFK